MTGRADESVLSSWDWVEEEFPNGTRLLFVRDIPPERIITALEADPADTQSLTLDVTFEMLVQPFARVGRTGEWAFCIDNCAFNMGEFSPTAQELSAGTELALLDTYVHLGLLLVLRRRRRGDVVRALAVAVAVWQRPGPVRTADAAGGTRRRTAPRRRPPFPCQPQDRAAEHADARVRHPAVSRCGHRTADYRAARSGKLAGRQLGRLAHMPRVS